MLKQKVAKMIQKVAQNGASSLGYFIFSKNQDELPKVAQLAKNCPIWSHCLWLHNTFLLAFKSELLIQKTG
jgi:hypothetical protein